MGLFDPISDMFGTSNKEKVKSFDQSQSYNPNAFQYGGQAGLAEQDANRYSNLGAAAQQRTGTMIDTGMSDVTRGQQGDMAGLMAARARGQTPSIAEMQGNRATQQAVAQQASAAAGARGPAALALAQQNAAGNVAQAQSDIAGQTMMNAAQERLAAEQAAYGAYSGMRGADEQRAMAQAQLFDAQRGRNDAFQMGMTQNEMAVRNAQQQGLMGQQQLLAGNQAQAQGANAGIAGQNAATNQRYVGAAMGFTKDAVGGLTNLSDARAKMGAMPLGMGGGGGGMLSDVTSKTGLSMLGGPNSPMGGGGMSPMSGPAAASYDAMSPGGGMNVMGSLANHSAAATQYAGDPSGGMMMSDDRAKVRDAKQDAYMLGLQDAAATSGGGGQGGGLTSQFSEGLAPYAYQYKEGFGTPGQKVGPMAQSMAANPVTATAVRQDPQSGLLAIDRDDGLKVALGGVGHLAQKQRAQDEMIAQLAKYRPNGGY